MKTALPILAAALTLAFAAAPRVQAQQPGSSDSGWNTRFAALEEERASQAGVAVSIVFDDSGSMAEHSKMRMAKQAFRAWIADAPATYRFGLTAINAGRLAELQRDNKADILKAVDKLQPGGDTPLANTIASVGKEIIQRRAAGSPYERQVMVVLTDGEDNTRRGPRGVQQEMQKLRAQQVEIIAFGYQGEGQYMRDSATRFFSPDNEADIRRGLNVIAAEIGDTSDIVVDETTLKLMQNPAITNAAAIAPPNSADAPVRTPAAAATPATPAPYTPHNPSHSKTPPSPNSNSHGGRIFALLILLGAGYFLFGRGGKSK